MEIVHENVQTKWKTRRMIFYQDIKKPWKLFMNLELFSNISALHILCVWRNWDKFLTIVFLKMNVTFLNSDPLILE